jgi:hypothetical protein
MPELLPPIRIYLLIEISEKYVSLHRTTFEGKIFVDFLLLELYTAMKVYEEV